MGGNIRVQQCKQKHVKEAMDSVTEQKDIWYLNLETAHYQDLDDYDARKVRLKA